MEEQIKSKRKQPEGTVLFNFNLPLELKIKCEAKAKQEFTDMSQIVIRALILYLG